MTVLAAQSDGYRAAHEGVARWDSSTREAVRVVGPERASFLQGMVSNEVEKLAVGSSCEATALTPKGAMVAFVRVHARQGELLLDVPPGQGAVVKAFLEKYLISEDCEVQDAGDVAVLGLVGPGAQALVERVPAEARLAVAPGLLGSGVDVVVPRARLDELVAALGPVPLLDADTVEVLRVEAGVPRWGVELTETTIPLEANLERAIHPAKGCYIGQEVIARATARGAMNKRLMGFLCGEATPAVGAELRVGERKVGWLTSVARSPAKGQVVALGYLHRDFVGQAGFEVPLPAGGVAKAVPLPFA